MPKKDDIFQSDEFLNLKDTQQKVERPDGFAKLFCEAAKSQTAVKDLLKEIIQDLLETDVKAQNVLKRLIQEVFKQDWRAFIKTVWGKFALIAWTAITALIAVLIDRAIK